MINSSLTVERPPRSVRYRLINCGGTVLSSLGLSLASLEEESLLKESQRITGLKDFGDDSFRVPLQKLLESLNKEANLNFVGQASLRKFLLERLVNRLRIQEDFKRYPEIAKVPIEKPLFVIGLPRSGTTFLHNLLSQDPSSRWLHLWELLNPSPSPDYTTRETDPRIGEAKKLVESINSFIPELSTIHHFNPNGPEECNILFEHDLTSIVFEMNANVPSYTEWFLNQDLVTSYRYYRRQLQLLAWKWSGKHWLLKAPIHLNYLLALITVFPDARIIHIHRDPLKVVPSLCSYSALFRAVNTDSLDFKAIGEQWLNWFAIITKRSIEMRQTIPTQQIYDLNYTDLVSDPIRKVRQIYDYFDYDFDPVFEENLKRYINTNPQHKHGVHRYSLDQFGLDASKVTKTFENSLYN